MPQELPQNTSQKETIALPRETLAQLGLFVYGNEGTRGLSSAVVRQVLENAEDLSWETLIHPDDLTHAQEIIQRVRDGRLAVGRFSHRLRDTQGNWRHIMSTVVRDTHTSPPVIMGIDHDVTHLQELRRQAEDAQRQAEQMAHEAEALRVAGAVIAASLDKVDMVSRVVQQLQGLIELEHVVVLERQSRELAVVSSSAGDDEAVSFLSGGFGRECLLACLRSGMPEVFRDPRAAHNIWLAVPLMIRGEPEGVCAMRRIDGRTFNPSEIRMTLAVADYLAIALHNGRLYEGMSILATTDHLSQLLNRHAFFLEARRALDESRRAGIPVTVLIADIDHFKKVNDQLGHLAGDEAIRGVAGEIARMVRDVDVLGRYGGEEFAAILPGAGPAEAQVVAERIREAVSRMELPALGRRLTCSIGTCTDSPSGEGQELDHLLERADQALYAAKRGGRNRVVAAPPSGDPGSAAPPSSSASSAS